MSPADGDGLQPSSAEQPLPQPGPRMLQARAFIESHYHQPVTPTRVARHVGMATAWLQREFRRTWGETPQQTLLNCRMQEAERLLDAGIDPSDVAQQVGYSSARAFVADHRYWSRRRAGNE